MRILLSCLQSLKSHALPRYDFWRTYFVCGLREAGHDVVEVPGVDWAEALIYPEGPALEAWRARTWEAVHDFVFGRDQDKRFDLFLSYLYPKQVEPTAIRDLQRHGIACVNFFCDNIREFRRVPQEYEDFTLHWVPEFEALEMYKVASLNHIHAPMPCWIPPSFREPNVSETESASFIGSADELRRDLLGRALDLGADFVVRGVGWGDNLPCFGQRHRSPDPLAHVAIRQIDVIRRHGISGLLNKIENRIAPLKYPAVPARSICASPKGDAEYFRITRESIVTIGVNRAPIAGAALRRPRRYSRLRDIEAPMLGACYLTEEAPGLDILYPAGTEIETYQTPDDLAAKLAELQKSEVRRHAMRVAAQKRALNDLSIRRTMERIATKLSL